jgi:hypothetical protein
LAEELRILLPALANLLGGEAEAAMRADRPASVRVA